MNTAEYLIKKLEELGINDFFGLPGDYNFNILYAIENNPNTNWIGCTNELNAGYAADGYARQRGYGALITTYGVGELSAINAIAGSYAENIPVINIVGVPSSKDIEDKTLIHHNFSQPRPKAYYDSYKSVTETAAFLNRDNAKLEIDRILKIFVKEKRPVYIAIPIDIAKMEISDRDVDYAWTSDSDTLDVVIYKINEKIKNSKKPIVLGDVLIKRYDARIEFKEFVEKSGIPVTNFMMGTNLISPDYKNYLGTYFSGFRNPTAQKWLEKTDCLIAVGAIYSDLNAFGFNLPYKINSHIAIYGTYTYINNIRYDNIKMSDVLEGLSKVVDSHNFDIEIEKFKYEKPNTQNTKLTSEYFYPRIQELLKENDILIAETGIIPQGVAQIELPNNVEVQTQTLWGSIGWATPATLGTCIANRNSRVILLTGEGSHQLTAMELGSMLRYGVKPIIIVLNNNGYTIERILSDNPDDKFNDIMQMNYSKFARVFDGEIWSTKVETAEDFDKALKVTQIMNKLCYIEACMDKMDAPALTTELIAHFKEKSEEKSKRIMQKYCSQIENTTLTKQEDMNFSTKVHESLRQGEDSDE